MNDANAGPSPAKGATGHQPARVIVVSEYAAAAQNSTGYFWSKVIEQLKGDGLEVCLHAYTKELSPRARASVPLRMLTKMQIALRLSWLVFRSLRRHDVVVAGTNPEVMLPILVLAKWIRGAKLCVLVHDVFPENRVPAGVLKHGSLAYKVLSAVYRRVYRSFDATIVIGRDMQELVDRKTGRPGSVFIQNWVDAEDVLPADRMSSGLLADLGWQDHVVFQFFGNMGRLQGIPELLDAIDRCRSTNAAFLFGGAGVMRPQVAEAFTGHPRRYLLPLGHTLTRNNVLSSCDVALVCLHREMLGLGVPSKAYFSLAADRPILAFMEPTAEVARLVREHGVGWNCASSNPQEMAALIDRVCESVDVVQRGRCRALIEGPFSKDRALKSFSDRVRALLPDLPP